MNTTPTTLQEAVAHFASYENCHRFLLNLRWPDGEARCPRCGSDNVGYFPKARVFECFEHHRHQRFSLIAGTIFEDSTCSLEKWLPVVWLLVNAKDGISPTDIHRAVGVQHKTAWQMLQRARLREFIHHDVGYVNTNIPNDRAEYCWSSPKLTADGDGVRGFHVFRYFDEERMDGGDRFTLAMRKIVEYCPVFSGAASDEAPRASIAEPCQPARAMAVAAG